MLEYMDGGSLRNVISQLGRIPEKALANMAFQMIQGLLYLKKEKRFHRVRMLGELECLHLTVSFLQDLKPSNILINSRGQVKLADFGVSAELRNSIGRAWCGLCYFKLIYIPPTGVAASFVGTFKYMAPERILHKPYGYILLIRVHVASLVIVCFRFPSDVWSLGIVLVECATGLYPYPECDTCIEVSECLPDP